MAHLKTTSLSYGEGVRIISPEPSLEGSQLVSFVILWLPYPSTWMILFLFPHMSLAKTDVIESWHCPKIVYDGKDYTSG